MKKIIAMLLVQAMCLALTACDSGDYKKATELYDSGSYAEARTMFAELENYQDSSEMVKACNYAAAESLFEDSDYDGAAAAFAELGDYEDSTEMVTECYFSLAKQDIEDGKYAQCIQHSESIDNADYRKEIASAVRLEMQKQTRTFTSNAVKMTDAWAKYSAKIISDVEQARESGKTSFQLTLDLTDSKCNTIRSTLETIKYNKNSFVNSFPINKLNSLDPQLSKLYNSYIDAADTLIEFFDESNYYTMFAEATFGYGTEYPIMTAKLSDALRSLEAEVGSE